jgi:hypothetical protein
VSLPYRPNPPPSAAAGRHVCPVRNLLTSGNPEAVADCGNPACPCCEGECDCLGDPFAPAKVSLMPTAELPGTAGHLAVLQERARLGLALVHARDVAAISHVRDQAQRSPGERKHMREARPKRKRGRSRKKPVEGENVLP